MAKKPKRRKPQSKDAPTGQLERRSLSTAEIATIAQRAARLSLEADAKEDALKDRSSKERKAIKSLRKQVRELNRQVAEGAEYVPAGDLFADRTTRESKAREKEAASRGLAEATS